MSSSDQKTLLRLDSAPTSSAAGEPRHGARVEPVRAGAGSTRRRPGRAARCRTGRPRSRHSSTSRSAAAKNRPGLRSVRPRSLPAVAHRDPPALARARRDVARRARTRRRRTARRTPGLPSSWPIGRTVTPVRVQREHEVRQAPVPLATPGSERNSPKPQSANAARELQVFWPLSSQPPSRPRGGGAQRRQVAARLRLRPGLRPDLLAGGHRRQEPGQLLGRAVLEEGRREQEDAVLADPSGRAGRVVLLLEDQPLAGRRRRARRTPPARTRPTSAPRRASRSHSRCAAKPSAVSSDGSGSAGHVRAQPRPHLGAELLLRRPELKIHAAAAFMRRRPARRASRRGLGVSLLSNNCLVE